MVLDAVLPPNVKNLFKLAPNYWMWTQWLQKPLENVNHLALQIWISTMKLFFIKIHHCIFQKKTVFMVYYSFPKLLLLYLRCYTGIKWISNAFRITEPSKADVLCFTTMTDSYTRCHYLQCQSRKLHLQIIIMPGFLSLSWVQANM